MFATLWLKNRISLSIFFIKIQLFLLYYFPYLVKISILVGHLQMKDENPIEFL
jgi:hypothetical protein